MVSVAEPDTVPDVAVIVTVPGATPIAIPDAFTVATNALLVCQEKVAAGITTLAAVRAVAVKFANPPATIVVVIGATVTLATTSGGGGVPTSSLQAPNEFAAGAPHVPSPARCIE